MTYTLTQLTALESAYAAGATRVSYDGKSVEYRSLQEMRQIIEEIRAALDGTNPRRRFRATTRGDKGL